MSRLRLTASFTAGAVLAAALTLTGTQAFRVGAAAGDSDATYQPLDPCRIVDTRPAPDTVGPRTSPLGPAEVFTVQITGTNGNCVDIPAGAAGVAMNVTVLNATAPSNLRVYPADLAEPPLVSNLNYSATSPPTPNKVDSKLSLEGEVNLLNAFGSVDVVVDVVGVYVNDSLRDLEARLAAAEAVNGAQAASLSALTSRVDALEARDVQLDQAIRDATPTTIRREGGDRSIDENWSAVVSYVGVNQTRDGTVLVFASTTAVESQAGTDVICVITNSTTDFDENDNMRWEAAGPTAGSTSGEGDGSNLAGVESFVVTAGSTGNYYLMCRSNAAIGGSTAESDSVVWDPQITLLFIPLR